MKELRDSIKSFDDFGTAIFGVSVDPVDSHKKFCDELTLPFDLLSDPDKKVHQAYGFKGPVRALVLIDKNGIIQFVNKKFALNKREQWDELLKEVAALKK